MPSDADRDGTRWILEILDRAPDYLAPGGRLFFPVLTLSREERIVAQARERFAEVTQVEELAADGSIYIEQRGSRWCWATKIYVARGAG